MQTPERILELIKKFQEGSLTHDERAILDNWYQSFDQEDIDLSHSGFTHPHQIAQRIQYRLENSIRTRAEQTEEEEEELIRPLPFFQRYRTAIGVAAIFLVLAFSAIIWLLPNGQNPPIAAMPPKPPVPPNDLAPGGNKAILTLDDGSTVVLDNAQNGVIGEQGVTNVQKLENGQVAYTLKNNQGFLPVNKVYYNTITTPRGGEYQITLADGSRVWLNAASSIRFPTVFIGTNREVEITGEAYFEVAHNERLPFIVHTGRSAIEVLGTSFNVNAYEDENVLSTSLVEGSVKIRIPNQAEPQLLKPGQQARLNRSGKLNLVNDANMEEVLAWKNGLFIFNSSDLRSIMRQISRWYDVDIMYKGDVDMRFTGQITRNDNVSKVFEKLELTEELRFRVDNGKIIVSR
jgi:ferric-dicitrate binding protein FerR (iron transport regulator)